MIRTFRTGLVLLVLAACGADGLPIPPSDRAPDPGASITVSGEGRFGVTASN